MGVLLKEIMNQKGRQFALGLTVLKEKGYNCWGPFIHAWHETGGFNRIVGEHNYWGMKCPKRWTGLMVNIITHEDRKLEYEEGGEKKTRIETIQIRSNFVDFGTLAQSMEFYDYQIQRLYKDAYALRFDPISFWSHLVDKDEPGEFRWATDEGGYTAKLMKTYMALKADPSISEFIP